MGTRRQANRPAWTKQWKRNLAAVMLGGGEEEVRTDSEAESCPVSSGLAYPVRGPHWPCLLRALSQRPESSERRRLAPVGK